MNLGFIAQQVQQLFPELVSTTSSTSLTPDGTLTLNYVGLISPIVAAIQALAHQVTSLEATVAGFADNFVSAHITVTTGDFQQVNTQKLCVTDGPSDQSPICVSKAQLAALLAGSSQQTVQIGAPTPPVISGTSTPPPTITINGSNPATIRIGDTYVDLGATITGPTADLNLGIKTFLNGALVSNIIIDTSSVATDTIDYVATDTAGQTSTSTRTVIIQVANDNQVSITLSASNDTTPPLAATGTSATSTP
jgi:hypothetical protein